MRVILFATGDCAEIDALNPRTPASLLPLVDKLFVQHVAQTLSTQGATSIDLIVSREEDRFVAAVGNGKEYGLPINFHSVPAASRQVEALKSIKFMGDDEMVLVAHADRLPQIEKDLLVKAKRDKTATFFLSAEMNLEAETYFAWSGWAVVPASAVRSLDAELNAEELGDALIKACANMEMNVSMPNILSARTFESLLAAQAAVLSGSFTGLELAGSMMRPGILVGHGTSIHPSATLTAPLYIGNNCCIAERAHVGPNTVIGDNCVIDASSAVCNSLVLAGTYIGEGLDVSNCMADRDRLVHATLGASLSLSDEFLLSAVMEERTTWKLSDLLAQPAAAAVLLFTLPALTVSNMWLKMVRPTILPNG